MKKECIFKVSGGSDWYRVYRNFVLGVGPVFEVYRGRRHIVGIWRYVDFDSAVDKAVRLAVAGIYFIKDGEDVK